MKMKGVQKTALGGIITALIAVLMFAEGFVRSGQYAAPTIAGLMLLSMSYATGKAFALYAYGASGLIVILLCPDKEAALIFILFAGYYPLIRDLLEKIPIKPLVFLVKLVFFNAAALAVYYLSIYVIGLPVDDYIVFGVDITKAFFFMLNILFICYDRMLVLFDLRLRKRIITVINKFFGS